MSINKRKILPIFILIAIFTISFLLMIFSAFKDSQTTDEAIHLVSGYTYLTKGDFRLDPEHPPLLKELGALPLLFFRNLNFQTDGLWERADNFYYDSWLEARVIGERFFYEWGNDPAILLFWSRLPFIILTLILGLGGFFWARKLYGIKAGIFAAFLILILPNILAHGRLVNTDLGLSLFAFLSVYFWGNYLKSPKLLNLSFAGLSVGLMLSSKFTGLIFIPILILLAVIKVLFFSQKKLKDLVKYTLGFLFILLLSFLVIWATYGFSLKIPSQVPASFIGEYLWGDRQLTVVLTDFLNQARFVLFPSEFYKGIYLVTRHVSLGHEAYLLGSISNQGWWYYFPITILIKTPISIFIFLGLTIIYFKKIRAKNLFDELLLIVPPTVFLISSMLSKADLGVRHILPIFPFLLVFISKSINLVDYFKNKIFALFFGLLLVWYFVGTLIAFPNFLSYFNEFIGGPKNGHKILTDSNLDWGQDIYRLKKYLRDNNLKNVYMVYPWNGDAALKYSGINYQKLAPNEQDIHGTVIISATYLKMPAFKWLENYPTKQITPGLFRIDIP